MARHNVVYVKAWCARDNPLGKVVPGTPNRANGIGGVVSLPKVNFQYLGGVALYYG